MKFVELKEENKYINDNNKKNIEENYLTIEKNDNNLNLYSDFETSLYKVK